MTDAIIVRGARLHNLRNTTVVIPKNRLVVLGGVPGSYTGQYLSEIL